MAATGAFLLLSAGVASATTDLYCQSCSIGPWSQGYYGYDSISWRITLSYSHNLSGGSVPVGTGSLQTGTIWGTNVATHSFCGCQYRNADIFENGSGWITANAHADF